MNEHLLKSHFEDKFLDKSQLEKLQFRDYDNRMEIKKDGTVIIEGVNYFRASKNISFFVAGLSFEDISNSLSRLTYDEEAQRRLKDGEPFLKDRQVKEFMNVLKKGEDIIGNIVWNLRTEEGSKKQFEYNPLTKTLLISPEQNIYITDGYHRTKACNNLLKEEPDSNLSFAKLANFTVQIHFLSKTKERDRFGKINHNTNQLSHSKRKRVLDDLRSEFVRNLIDKTFLNGIIEEDIDNLSLNKLYTFNQLSNAIFGQKGIFKKYKLEEENNYQDLLNFLTNFFNYLPKVRKEFTFENDEEKRNYLKDNLILEPIMLYSYMTVAKEMMNRKSDFSLLEEYFQIKLQHHGRSVWFFSKKSGYWTGKILYENGNSISGYPPQTCLIDETINVLKMIK